MFKAGIPSELELRYIQKPNSSQNQIFTIKAKLKLVDAEF